MDQTKVFLTEGIGKWDFDQDPSLFDQKELSKLALAQVYNRTSEGFDKMAGVKCGPRMSSAT
jgi:hypothetical protein